MDNMAFFWDMTGAVLVGVVVFAICAGIWRLLAKRLRGDGTVTFKSTLAGAVSLSVYLVFGVLALKIWLQMAPAFSRKPDFTTLVHILGHFFFVVFISEGVISVALDYYVKTHRGTEVPRIFQQLFKAILYTIVALSILSTTYKIDVTPLLTTSAVFTMVIGLALQDTLGNLFAGLSVHISPPFKIGEWIKVGGLFGRVVQANWRCTTLITSFEELIVLPNNDIAKKEIINYSILPGNLFVDYYIDLPYDTSPEQAKNALVEVIAQTREILRDPPPKVLLDHFAASSIKYRLRFWINENMEQSAVKDKLASRLWYKLKRDGIVFPYPVTDVFVHPEKDLRGKQIEHRLNLLSQVDFLHILDRAQIAYLSQNSRDVWYDSGESIVEKGSHGTEFFLIDRGGVAVFLESGDKEPIARLGAGQFFGEMSLLTGEPRSATVKAEVETQLIAVSKESMGHILHEYSHVAKALSEVLAERAKKNQTRLESAEQGSADQQAAQVSETSGISTSVALLERIRGFFGLA